MDSISLRGLGVALVTPFKKNKDIDFEALERVVEHIITGGADYIVVLGTTGETPTLTESEKREVRKFVVDKTAGCVPLVLGFGGNCTRALVEDMKTTDFTGFSAILSVTPFYNKPSQEGLYLHFSEIAKNSPLPVILYNVPGRTGINIKASTTLRLAHDYSNIIGIKEASGSFKQIEEIINGKPEGFHVVSGDDALTYPLITLGAEGVISVVGNAFPAEFGRMVRLCLDGNYQEALPIHYRFSKLYDELFVDGNPAGVKSLLHHMGLIENELRLPLVPTRIETGEELKNLLQQLTH
jgi:4-hydroxy-tetrahydrodipicolinate synthase